MSGDQFRVSVDTNLNLRSEPVVSPGTRLALLADGQRVSRLDGDPTDDWWRVSTEIQGARVEGWVARRYLAPAREFDEPRPQRGVTAVHLRENDARVTRDLAARQAFPLGEPGRPVRVADSAADRVRDLSEIIAWLRVDESARYQPVGSTTYCNIYAYDYCYLAGAYLPRVWWTPRALARIASGEAVAARYAETVSEVNANMLYQWLLDYGADFGWARTFDATELQEAVNGGGIGVISAQRKELNQPGHISMVVPEAGTKRAARSGDGVKRPLQSQAGRQCFRYGTGHQAWWTGRGFRAFGFWHHA